MSEDTAELVRHYRNLKRNGGIVSRCEMWLPPLLAGRCILDVECRRGRGVYKLSDAAGRNGVVIGCDSRADFIKDAEAHADENIGRNGLLESNMRFFNDYPEDLHDIDDASVDVIIANSVLNLTYDRAKVLGEFARVLKEGGELYHAGLFSVQPLEGPQGEGSSEYDDAFACATTLDELRSELVEAGLGTYFVLGLETVHPDEASAIDSEVDFEAGVIRAFKQADGAATGRMAKVCYLGDISGSPDAFQLADSMTFPAAMTVLVEPQAASALQSSRYAPHFRIQMR